MVGNGWPYAPYSGGGAPAPRQTVCAGTKAWVWAETGVKMHSCEKRTQLVQRPSSEASKPEQRICAAAGSAAVGTSGRGRVYLAPSAVAAGDGGALARGGLVLLVHVRRWLSVGVRRRRAGIHLVRRRQAVGLLLL